MVIYNANSSIFCKSNTHCIAERGVREANAALIKVKKKKKRMQCP